MTGKNLWLAMVIAALLGAVAAAEDAMVIKTNIPFDFMVGDQRLPAGEYVFAHNGMQGPMRITSWNTRSGVTVLRNPAGRNTTGFPYALVFNNYGDRHFLKQIWTGPETGIQVPPSREEKEDMAARAEVKSTLMATATR